jgi:hypothetical protein
MFKVSYKIYSILLALVVLCSTTTFTFNKHYCGNFLVETSLYHLSDGCGMSDEVMQVESCNLIKKKCCSDEQFTILGQNKLQSKFEKISLYDNFYAHITPVFYRIEFVGEISTNTTYKLYRPPLVKTEFFKLYETYLI